jgi:hypothetical protein
MLNPELESVGFQKEPAIFRVAGSLWNLAHPLQIPLWKKQRTQQGLTRTLKPDETYFSGNKISLPPAGVRRSGFSAATRCHHPFNEPADGSKPASFIS